MATRKRSEPSAPIIEGATFARFGARYVVVVPWTSSDGDDQGALIREALETRSVANVPRRDGTVSDVVALTGEAHTNRKGDQVWTYSDVDYSALVTVPRDKGNDTAQRTPRTIAGSAGAAAPAARAASTVRRHSLDAAPRSKGSRKPRTSTSTASNRRDIDAGRSWG